MYSGIAPKKILNNVLLLCYIGTKWNDLLVDYVIKDIHEKLRERAGIKAIRKGVRMRCATKR